MESRRKPLRIGVVGLSRLWDTRHRPARDTLGDRIQVVAVYDQVERRATLESKRLGCGTAEGLHELVARPDLDAVYLFGSPWFGVLPLRLAAQAGKAIYCAMPWPSDLTQFEAVVAQVEAAGVPAMFELPQRFAPATTRLRELLATRLGRPRMILGSVSVTGIDRFEEPGPVPPLSPAPLRCDPGGAILDWCRFLLESEPQTLHGFGGPWSSRDASADRDYEAIVLEFPGGALAQLALVNLERAAWNQSGQVPPSAEFQILAESGTAWVELPNRIRWTDAEGNHAEQLPPGPSLGRILNEEFLRLVSGEPNQAPTLRDALDVARWLQALDPGVAPIAL